MGGPGPVKSFNTMCFGASPIFAVGNYTNPFITCKKTAPNAYYKTFVPADDIDSDYASKATSCTKARLFNNAAKDVIPEEDNKKKRKLDV